MFCFRDMSFCVHSKTCGNTDCYRNYDHTENTEDMPVALTDFKNHSCGYVPKEGTDVPKRRTRYDFS